MAATTSRATLVALQQVAVRFADGTPLFESLDLVIDGAPTGIVGRNGAGKSILAQLIAGQRTPTGGAVVRHTTVAYVAQQPIDAPSDGTNVAQVTGLSAQLAALSRLAAGCANEADFDRIGERWDLAERLQDAFMAAGLGPLDPARPARTLSGGQRARVALIGAFLSAAGLLVLDEPSNHLDRDGRLWLQRQLAAWRGGLVLVSHDRALLADMRRIVEVTPYGLRTTGGTLALHVAQREAEQAAARAALEHARTERDRARRRLERAHDTIQRHAAGTRRYAETANLTTAAKVGLKQAAVEAMGHVRQQQREAKQALSARVGDAAARVEDTPPVLLSLPGSAPVAHRRLWTLDRARLPWLAVGDPAATVTWSARGPVRIALTGPNGCGKSTLLRLLAGTLAPVTGLCRTHVPVAYLDQALTLLDPERSVVEQLGLLDTPLAEGELRSRLALLQLDAQRATQPSGLLSGGERLKAALACAAWRGTPAQLLLLDEPTNHLDLASVQAMEAALRGYTGALVVVSHDDAFVEALAPTHTMRWSAQGWRYGPTA
ncbi:ATP-binding cassette domain-containing protein [uncultured Xanthomonas sp.]|uniref:ATP-binding cassette domain-containing protein n=1 Tax=uncultured Xanthomonas sp. TaxID=152831 RepID=UPI0025EC4497|nr:ATP-binding cassette domain-containing protein [uncultured Xanthomonas sp.]